MLKYNGIHKDIVDHVKFVCEELEIEPNEELVKEAETITSCFLEAIGDWLIMAGQNGFKDYSLERAVAKALPNE